MINRHLDPYGYMIPEIFNDEEPAYDPNLPLHIEDECKVWLDGQDASTFTLNDNKVIQWDDKGVLGADVSNDVAVTVATVTFGPFTYRLTEPALTLHLA